MGNQESTIKRYRQIWKHKTWDGDKQNEKST